MFREEPPSLTQPEVDPATIQLISRQPELVCNKVRAVGKSAGSSLNQPQVDSATEVPRGTVHFGGNSQGLLLYIWRKLGQM